MCKAFCDEKTWLMSLDRGFLWHLYHQCSFCLPLWEHFWVHVNYARKLDAIALGTRQGVLCLQFSCNQKSDGSGRWESGVEYISQLPPEFCLSSLLPITGVSRHARACLSLTPDHLVYQVWYVFRLNLDFAFSIQQIGSWLKGIQALIT